VSESGNLKDQAEQEAREHPQQVKAGEQAIGDALGMNSQEGETSQHDQNSPPQDQGTDG